MNINTLQNISTVISGFLTPIIAIIAVWIAFMQWKTQRNQIRIALFEKRMKIFETIRDCLGIILADGSAKNIEWSEFDYAVQQSKFLLNSGLQDQILLIQEKINEMFRVERRLFGPAALPVGEKRNQLCDLNTELLTWLSSQSKPLEINFADFMKINKI